MIMVTNRFMLLAIYAECSMNIIIGTLKAQNLRRTSPKGNNLIQIDARIAPRDAKRECADHVDIRNLCWSTFLLVTLVCRNDSPSVVGHR